MIGLLQQLDVVKNLGSGDQMPQKTLPESRHHCECVSLLCKYVVAHRVLLLQISATIELNDAC